jgi:hypothetical protein
MVLSREIALGMKRAWHQLAPAMASEKMLTY